MNTQIDFEQARLNMIEQQIRTWEVLDQNVLDLLDQIHREDFVPSDFQSLALADTNIPLPNGQVMMTPKLEARLLQAVALNKNDSVLEIGTGCAYLTSLIAKSSKHVDSIDIFPDFTKEAKIKLENYQIENVNLITADALSDWTDKPAYDVIIVTGSVSSLNPLWREQLTDGGRLFVISGKSPVMNAQLITRIDKQTWSNEVVLETDLPALIGAEEPVPFDF